MKSGDTLRVFVEGRRGSELSVRAGGLRFRARIAGDVAPGRWYRVEVVSTGRTTVLRTLERPPAPVDFGSLTRAHGLPRGDAEAVVRAFVHSGLPLQSDRLALAWRRVSASERLSLAERARLAAVLEDKGLLDSVTVWERAVQSVSGGTQGSHGETRGDVPDEERGDEGRDDQDDRDGAGDDETDPVSTSSDDVGIAASDIRAAFSATHDPSDALQLLNHSRGRLGNWVVIPLEFGGAKDFSAALKMRLPPGEATGRRSFVEAVLDIRAGADRWTFGLIPGEVGVRVVGLAVPESRRNDSSGAQTLLEPLRERLSGLGIDFHTRIMSNASNDGFSTDDETAILRTVDSRA